MKLLVTGGAGFIGSNFIRYIISKYPTYHIVNIDALTYAGNLENLQTVENESSYTFVKGDITDYSFINHLFATEAFDYVINFAAESHVDRSITQPDIFTQTNIQGTQHLLHAAKQYGVKKYVQISTDEVYGTLGETGFFTEDTPLAPNSPYSASKASADLLVRAYYETFGLPVNITRCSNNYGPFHFPEKLIPLMIINTLHNKPLPIYGDGLQVRDWLHVEDHCRAIDLILHNGRIGEVYNIGGNNEYTNIAVVKKIITYLGKSESLIQYVLDRPGHDRRYAIDSMKLQTELGWSPLHTFDAGIKQTIQWYVENEKWWRKIISGQYKEYYNTQYKPLLTI
ncbi:dTDP-glucose 4,6-dehydratase [Bacillus fungorum]|uniref:dTDP-glucose 4,6-dehydratase n=1 Tax=Bacillus fungorum TaxID=2039284 RepID=A0A2G6QGQ6_9BACI|nr:dTDP-glucose 4,6-dehydratase [Bacillus fungorum]PIE96003.1 dTDP-glucose 4,6-dehydratase [Bacillus fungorum]